MAPCGRTITVNTVSTGTQDCDVFSVDLRSAGKRKLLIPAPNAAIGYLDGNFSAADQTNLAACFPQIAQTSQQVFASAKVIPVVSMALSISA